MLKNLIINIQKQIFILWVISMHGIFIGGRSRRRGPQAAEAEDRGGQGRWQAASWHSALRS